MRKTKRYSPEEKLEVLAYLEEGGTVQSAAHKFNVPESTVHTWAKKLDGAVQTVVCVPDLPDFSVNGVLSVMRARYDEAMQLAETYDKAIVAVQALEQAGTQLRKFQAEIEGHRQALSFFLKEERK